MTLAASWWLTHAGSTCNFCARLIHADPRARTASEDSGSKLIPVSLSAGLASTEPGSKNTLVDTAFGLVPYDSRTQANLHRYRLQAHQNQASHQDPTLLAMPHKPSLQTRTYALSISGSAINPGKPLLVEALGQHSCLQALGSSPGHLVSVDSRSRRRWHQASPHGHKLQGFPNRRLTPCGLRLKGCSYAASLKAHSITSPVTTDSGSRLTPDAYCPSCTQDSG